MGAEDFWQLVFAVRAHKDDDPYTAAQYADKAKEQFERRRRAAEGAFDEDGIPRRR